MLRAIFLLRAQCSKLRSQLSKENITGLQKIFADNKKKEKGLKAIWGDNIFEEIRTLKNKKLNVTLLDHLHSYKLSEHISDCLEAAKVTAEEIRNSKQQVMEAFDIYKGVEINKAVLSSQDRIDEAVNKSNGFLTFYPSSTVAPIVFESLDHVARSRRKQMIVGKPGISKTMSFLMGQYLMNLSVPFRFGYPKDTAVLMRHKLLKEDFAKVVYMSFNL